MISIIEEKEDIINSSIKKGLEVEEEIEERMMGPSVQLSGHRSEIYCTKFSDCGTLLGSGGKDKDIFIWSVFSARFENSVVIKGHINSILDMCWSWDSEQIFSCGADRTVCIWDVQQATRIKKYRGHESFVNSIAVVRRGPEQLLSASDDCTVRMWDSRIRDQVHQIRRSYQITAVSFSHNSDGFFYAGVDNQIKFYNLRTNQDEYALIGHTDTITDIQLSHSGNFLLSNAMDHTVKYLLFSHPNTSF
jgi:Prp8 binding protein